MTTLSHTEMHRDHLLWLGENDLWRDYLRAWKAEVSQAIEQSTELDALFEAHQRRLQIHAAAIRAHEQDPRQHEHDIAEHEKGEISANLIGLAVRHQTEALSRQEQRAAHQDLSRDHYAILTHWNALMQALRDSAKRLPQPASPKTTPSHVQIEF